MATAKFQELDESLKQAIRETIPGTPKLDQLIPFLDSVMCASAYASGAPVGTCTSGEYFKKLYNAVIDLTQNEVDTLNVSYDIYPPGTKLTTEMAARKLFEFFSNFALPISPDYPNPTTEDPIAAINDFAMASPQDSDDFNIKLDNMPIGVINGAHLRKLLENVLGLQSYNPGNKSAVEEKLWTVGNTIFDNNQSDAASAIRPLKQYCYLRQFRTPFPINDGIIEQQLLQTLGSIEKAASNPAIKQNLKKILKNTTQLGINNAVTDIDSALTPTVTPPEQPEDSSNKQTTPNTTKVSGTADQTNQPQDSTPESTGQFTGPSPEAETNYYGLDPRVFEILSAMAVDEGQLREALEVLAEGGYQLTPFLTTYHPKLSEVAVKQLLDNETDKASHRPFDNNRPFRVSADEPGTRKTVLIPPAFKEDKSQTIWSRAVINNLGFPFINFSSPAVLALIKSSDPKEVKAAYKNVKSLFKECRLKRPIDTLKEFAKAKYRNSALNALAVQADELYNAESGMKVSTSIIAPYTKNISLKGNVELPMDFLTAFYTVLSPVHATAQYTELCDMQVSEYLNYLSVNGKPPMYILNPKNIIFRRGPKAGLLHELFSSKTAPILVRARVGGRDGGFMIPERIADKIFTV